MRDDEKTDTAAIQDRHDDSPAAEPLPDIVDEASDGSFPASDPPANTPITGVGCPCQTS